MLHINTTLTYDEAEAAMCLWEDCLSRLTDARHQGGLEAMENCDLWNWLRGGEGAACARDACLSFATDIEYSYRLARDHFGFDDSFDWEFVPRWADYAMEVTEEHFLDEKWNKYIAYKVTQDWKEIFR